MMAHRGLKDQFQPGTNRIGAAWGATNSYVTAGGSTGTSGAPINPYAFEWNGISWSNGGQLNNARISMLQEQEFGHCW